MSVPVDKFIAGAGTGIITKSITAPVERIKILFQVQGIKALKANLTGVVRGGTVIIDQPIYGRTLWSVFSKILRDDGFKGLWRGNLTNCVRVMPTYATKFGSNGIFKKIFKVQRKKSGFLPLILCGACAGATTVSLTYPFELVRTRLAFGYHMDARYNGIFDLIKKTYSQEGIRGF